MASFQAKIGWKMGIQWELKLSFHSVPTQCVIENSKKIAKKFKKSKSTVMALFQAKLGWKRLRKRENKSYHFVLFLPDA